MKFYMHFKYLTKL